jgi:hypothetical protein
MLASPEPQGEIGGEHSDFQELTATTQLKGTPRDGPQQPTRKKGRISNMNEVSNTPQAERITL